MPTLPHLPSQRQYLDGAVAFNLHTERGFSLDLTLSMIEGKAEVHWYSFLREALAKGMPTHQVFTLARKALAEYRQDSRCGDAFVSEALHKLRLYAVCFDPVYAKLGTNVEQARNQIKCELAMLDYARGKPVQLLHYDGAVVPVVIVQLDDGSVQQALPVSPFVS